MCESVPIESNQRMSNDGESRAEKWAKQLELHAKEAPPSEALSKPALVAYGGFALSMLGLGFGLGWKHQVKKNSGSEGLLLGERTKRAGGAAQVSQRVRKPSMEPVILARRALGIATLICLSSASLVSLGVAWYMDISTFQQFSDRLKVVVPERSKELQGRLNPTLNSVKGRLQTAFESLQPILVKGRNERTPEQIQSEREELKEAGLDVYLLDPSERE